MCAPHVLLALQAVLAGLLSYLTANERSGSNMSCVSWLSSLKSWRIADLAACLIGRRLDAGRRR